MPESYHIENDFIQKITSVIQENISNEQFGVSELASELGMSRSNLLRKVKKITDLSVSQFIRQVRLQKAVEILRENSLSVSEVSYEVGFSSVSYFIKCFRDFYGFPPGELSKQKIVDKEKEPKKRDASSKYYIITAVIFAIILASLIIFNPFSVNKIDKSIAVLPFKNDSNDSTNVYLINGLMEAILNNLQKIEDLRVISRTSVEKYRNSEKSIPEIAKELNVKYFIEGSGQKINDQILLNIQLIEAENDKHLWAEQYNRKTRDIFQLQLDVAKSIATQTKVIITPEEEKRINKQPTDNLLAYDYFLKGLEDFYKGTREGLEEAIPKFQLAIDEDPGFARAYADIAISYYLLDVNQNEKKYTEKINRYADKALLNDSQLPHSLIAKAVFFINSGEPDLALPYFEKALEYNPNSDMVLKFLTDFYVNIRPDTKKYLKYALMGAQVDIASKDSLTESYSYLHLSNALAQSGFTDLALKYINKSLDYSSDNLYSAYVKAYILYAKNWNLQETKNQLILTLKRDSTRLDIVQEVGKICYYMRDYKEAYHYYKWFMDVKTALNLDIYKFENAKIALVYNEMGFKDEANKLLDNYLFYAENDKSIYKHLSLAVYNSYKGNLDESIHHFNEFSKVDNFQYWLIIFLNIDPLIDNVKDLPEYKHAYKEIEKRFQKNHKSIKAELTDHELI